MENNERDSLEKNKRGSTGEEPIIYRGWKAMPFVIAALVFHIPIVQQQTFVVFQAIQSNRRLGKTSFQIPAASYTVFLMLAMSIWIPIYDRLLVPFLQWLTGKEGGITLLQRIGIGIFLSVIAMLVVSGFVEGHRRTIGLTKPIPGIQTRGDISSMSSFWLAPQLTLTGLLKRSPQLAKSSYTASNSRKT
ncbi:hypothetical protein C1H46_045169 [Malus baccata]|uniref:Uncharacterized protein n=1 Tax=Malus baccata TaxID=106549 RepID=A0A540K4Z0_MALBA|nr:hypothetical protein C1H46_045169 [Malus baccata]